MDQPRPKVATCVLIFKDGKVLLGKRKGTLAGGLFGTPGGHVEHLESIVDAVHREVKEECEVEIGDIRFVCVVNVRDFAPMHHVVIVLRADWKAGEPRNCEPEKCEGWNWFDLDRLPDPMTPATKYGIVSLQNGQTLFDEVE